ncbi:MAG: terminase family protein [Opitutaceae bacterium]|jgi:phage terminase large subunit-like protein|nr:terminase family protein [Opitutaceae bacterium]
MSSLSENFPREWLQPDPVLPLPTRGQVQALLARGTEGRAQLEKFLRERAELIRLRGENPLEYGFEPYTFRRARELTEKYDEVLLMGGNREGKTNFAAKFCVELLVKKPGAVAAFFHSSEKSSRLQQQPVIFSFLPPVWRAQARAARRAAKGDAYLGYAPGSGFTGEQFILPNGVEGQVGSTGLFFNYKQDVGVMEGWEFDVVWFDELVPMAFLEALTFRLSRTKRTIILTTFTPVRGYTPVVASYVGGARVVETRRAELLAGDVVHVRDCPPGHMPFVQAGARENSAVLYFHNMSNPYGAGKEVRKKLAGAAASVIKMRGYGWADRTVAGVFARFSMNVHVVSPKRVAELLAGPCTRYVAADPRPGVNWFIKWYCVTPEGWNIVYREWPDMQRYDRWALPPAERSDGRMGLQWRPGPAQFVEAGRGINGYKKLILEAEGWVWNEAEGRWDGARAERIESRLIDPRMGGDPVPGADEGTTIIRLMEDEERDRQGRVIGPSMIWEKGPASGVGDSVEMISSAMDYDETQRVSVLNCPKWYVSENCKQSIMAYQEFTNAGGQKDGLKDIIDCDRYFIKADLEYVAPNLRRVRRGGYY